MILSLTCCCVGSLSGGARLLTHILDFTCMYMRRGDITSGHSNLTTGRIAAAHGRFSGIRQVTPVCTRLIMLLWAHRSSNPKRHLDRFSHFCTAHGSVPSGIPGHVISPKNCIFAWGDLELMHSSLAPLESLTQTASQSVHRFCRAHYCHRQTDRQTDRTCYSVCSSRPHLRT